jgi:PAS domain S-box-containing protein
VWIHTLRRKVEQRTREIQRSAETQRLILDSALDAVIGVGRDERVVEWHPRATEIFGVPEEKALGTAIPRFLPGLRRHLNASGKPAAENRFELEARRADGTGFPVELSVSVLPKDREVSLILFVRDITGQRSLEEKLRQSQKMQAIGQLAGGIAHDFNNLLTVIRGNASIIREEARLEPEHGGALDEILAASERASSLTAQLLAFSRQQPMQPKVFDANSCIGNIVRMLGRLIGEDVRIETDLSSPSPLLRADQAMIEQVILNLAVNGRDAMPHGGVLSLSTRVVPVSGELARLHQRGEGGDYLRIEVRDTGTGIAPEHLPRVFEPFFTTKEVGKGTGLGLATVFGIVEQHGGWVTVESRLGEGSTFTVWLPCHTETTAPEPAMENPPTSGSRASSPAGHETILLVEDEDLVRLVGRRLLTRHGYRVIEARSGRHALELWQDHADEIDLLLTDVVMPEGISGPDLARRLLGERPALKVIYTSGYAAEIFRGEASLPGDAAFVGKPYRPEELLATVRSVLDGAAVEPLALPS